MANLFTTQTTNATSSTIAYASATTLVLSGVLDGAVIALDITDDGGTTWTTVDVMGRLGATTMEMFGTFSFRARLAEAGATTSVTLTYNGSA